MSILDKAIEHFYATCPLTFKQQLEKDAEDHIMKTFKFKPSLFLDKI